MWISANGKWKITDIEEKGEANYKVHATRTMRNDKNWLLIVNMLGQYQFMESNLGDANLPKYVKDNAIRLVQQIKENNLPVIKPAETEEVLQAVIDEQYLTDVAKQFLKDEYQMDLEIPIEVNARMSRTLGRFDAYANREGAIKIHISKNLIDYHPVEDVVDTLKHELVHYAVYSTTTGSKHRDGHPYFEGELKRLNIGRTGTLKTLHPKHMYSCTGCNNPEMEVHRNRKLDLSKQFVTRCCDAPLHYEGFKSPKQ